ncbi:hypothetical protein AVEN_8324-1 [Araneus ventricosus]|uniref:Uncharacterized protein n=1 Tax=Araneus ventricosus TaxID=182803 RepID=A0A4Y2RIX4_ARAVE|nr:hypothetical protein AVEN_8324-1 [Araneus ventricosus]
MVRIHNEGVREPVPDTTQCPYGLCKRLSSGASLSEVSAWNSPAACYPERLFEANTDQMFSFLYCFITLVVKYKSKALRLIGMIHNHYSQLIRVCDILPFGSDFGKL